jgi:hypothetical protein
MFKGLFPLILATPGIAWWDGESAMGGVCHTAEIYSQRPAELWLAGERGIAPRAAQGASTEHLGVHNCPELYVAVHTLTHVFQSIPRLSCNGPGRSRYGGHSLTPQTLLPRTTSFTRSIPERPCWSDTATRSSPISRRGTTSSTRTRMGRSCPRMKGSG